MLRASKTYAERKGEKKLECSRDRLKWNSGKKRTRFLAIVLKTPPENSNKTEPNTNHPPHQSQHKPRPIER